MALNSKLDCTSCQTLGLSVFCTLTREEIEQLNNYKSSFHVKKGQLIFYEESEPPGLYCVHHGKVKVFKTTNEGNIQILRLAKDGDIIGYRSLLAGEQYRAAAEAIEDSQICLIPKQYIFELLNNNIYLSLKIMENFARDLKSAEKKNVDLLHKTSKERLAESLLLLKDTFGVNDRGFINVVLNREDIANITGMATETVVRCLREWNDAGVIDLDKKLIRIINTKQLLDIANLND